MGQTLRDIGIGDWYRDIQTADFFEVVAVDDGSRTIEIQYYDGTVEEFDFESWTLLELEESAPPEDSSGAFDADREDLETDWVHVQEHDPLDEVERLLY